MNTNVAESIIITPLIEKLFCTHLEIQLNPMAFNPDLSLLQLRELLIDKFTHRSVLICLGSSLDYLPFNHVSCHDVCSLVTVILLVLQIMTLPIKVFLYSHSKLVWFQLTVNVITSFVWVHTRKCLLPTLLYYTQWLTYFVTT